MQAGSVLMDYLHRQPYYYFSYLIKIGNKKDTFILYAVWSFKHQKNPSLFSYTIVVSCSFSEPTGFLSFFLWTFFIIVSLCNFWCKWMSKVDRSILTTIYWHKYTAVFRLSVTLFKNCFDSNTLCNNMYLRKTCYCDIRQISKIRPFLEEKSAIQLAVSLALSKLDYCNYFFTPWLIIIFINYNWSKTTLLVLS